MSTSGQIKPELNPDSSEFLSAIDRHYEEGVQRAEAFICGLNQPPGVFMPPIELLPKREVGWSSDWRVRQLQAYVFDSVASTIPIGPADYSKLSDKTLELLCSATGRPDYFQAYCESRMISPISVLDLAHTYLDESASNFRRLYIAIFGRSFGDIDEDLVQEMLTSAVIQNAHDYPHEKTLQEIDDTVRELELDEKIDSSRKSQINLTVNVAHPSLRQSRLFLAPARGIEAYRGAMHALGHSVFSVVAPDIIDDYGVNISATESVAFQAQHLALDGATPEVADFLRFLHLYQSRLYAVRTIHEACRLDSRAPEHHMLQDLGGVHLGLSSLRPHVFRPKLVGVDFLLAFIEFYRQGEVSHNWSNIIALAKDTTNKVVAGDVLIK